MEWIMLLISTGNRNQRDWENKNLPRLGNIVTICAIMVL
jgi:hypothetical protein